MGSTSENITQNILWVEEKDKVAILLELLSQQGRILFLYEDVLQYKSIHVVT